MQAIGRQLQRVPDGVPVYYERHCPDQTTLYRLAQQHAATFFAQAKAAYTRSGQRRTSLLAGHARDAIEHRIDDVRVDDTELRRQRLAVALPVQDATDHGS